MLEISTTDKNDRVSYVYTQGDTNLGTVRTRTINLDHYRKPFFFKVKITKKRSKSPSEQSNLLLLLKQSNQ